MNKYYISVWVSVYADSAEMAKQEVRSCLNTGKGHIYGYEITDINKLERRINETRVPKTPPFDYPM